VRTHTEEDADSLDMRSIQPHPAKPADAALPQIPWTRGRFGASSSIPRRFGTGTRPEPQGGPGAPVGPSPSTVPGGGVSGLRRAAPEAARRVRRGPWSRVHRRRPRGASEGAARARRKRGARWRGCKDRVGSRRFRPRRHTPLAESRRTRAPGPRNRRDSDARTGPGPAGRSAGRPAGRACQCGQSQAESAGKGGAKAKAKAAAAAALARSPCGAAPPRGRNPLPFFPGGLWRAWRPVRAGRPAGEPPRGPRCRAAGGAAGGGREGAA
jgi:hypothetical protein